MVKDEVGFLVYLRPLSQDLKANVGLRGKIIAHSPVSREEVCVSIGLPPDCRVNLVDRNSFSILA